MKLFLTTLIMVILCIAGMAISIICRKGGKFPDGEISHNKELRSRGIECAKADELRRWGRRKNCRSCNECGQKGRFS